MSEIPLSHASADRAVLLLERLTGVIGEHLSYEVDARLASDDVPVVVGGTDLSEVRQRCLALLRTSDLAVVESLARLLHVMVEHAAVSHLQDKARFHLLLAVDPQGLMHDLVDARSTLIRQASHVARLMLVQLTLDGCTADDLRRLRDALS
jgi:hypothetical protein